MTPSLKPYPAYQDSGVPWLGQVPEHWRVRRNKLILIEVDDRSTDGTEELLTVSQYTGITRRRDRLSDDSLVTNAVSLDGYKRVSPGDLAMNIMLAWNGSLGVSSVSGIVSPAYCVFRTKDKTDSRFLHYLFRTSLFTGVFKTVSKGVVDSRLRLYPDVFLRLQSLLPPAGEQHAIVRYLDHADRKVRHAIHAQQQLIKLLTEQKQAIIQRAVTRGLDPNVRLKPSGVPWLGDFPEHWEVRRLKEMAKTNPSRSEVSSTLTRDTVVTFLPMHQVSATGLVDAGDARCASEVWNGFTYFRRSDVLVAKITPCFENGKGACLDSLPTEIGFGSTEFIVLRALRSVLPQYLYRLTLLADFRHLGADAMVGAAGQQRVPIAFVSSFPLPVPPLSEQSAIVRYLNSATADLDKAIDAARREIGLLREYRTRLIADVVTGKLDVRDAADHLPEEPEKQPEPLDEEPMDETGDLDAEESDGDRFENESGDA